MVSTSRRRIACAAVLLASCSYGSVASAQVAPPTIANPPIRSAVDGNGVNLTSGVVELSSTDVVIGSPGTSGLAHTRYWTTNGWRHGYFLTVSTTSTTAMVSIGGQSISFTLSGGVYTANQGNGAKLTSTATTFVYEAPDGSVVTFSKSYAGYFYYGSFAAVGTNIVLPDATTIMLTYKTITYSIAPFGTINLLRLQSVNDSNGYQLKFGYDNTNLFYINKVIGINNAVDYCAPAADICPGFSQSWPSTAYATNTVGSTTQESVTDPVGRVTRYSTDSSNRMVGIKRPASSTDTTIYGYDGASRVATVSNGSATWNYAFVAGTGILTGTIQDPAPHTGDPRPQTIVVADTAQAVITSFKDPNLRTTTYAYDAKGRLTVITYPEGNKLNYEYDAGVANGRGNVTKVTALAKATLPAPNIVTLSGYDTACANLKTCNKPNWTQDALGNQTDYIYDPSHGGITKVTAPAPTSGGVRPETRYSYTFFVPHFKNSSGVITYGPASEYRLTGVSTCQTTASCVGTADEVKTVIAYGSLDPSVANNLLRTSVSTGSGDGTTTPAATTDIAYDVFGNVFTVQGPLGAAYTTRYRYDAARQLVGVVGPDPDGGGLMKNRAIRNAYNDDGQVVAVEQGTVPSQSDPDWSSFNPLRTTISVYDTRGRQFRQFVTAPGAGTVTVFDVGYDAMNRPECTNLRMNPGAYGSLPAPCLPSTTGSFGPDRISKTIYDAASQVTKVQTAVGTADQRDEVTNTYTPNGKLMTLADGKGNLTTYEYDGFDRPVKTRYPLLTGGGSSTTDYDGVAFYDAASNVILRRTRDGSIINQGYDMLNRLTAIVFNGAPLIDNIAYNYDNLGRLAYAGDAAGNLSTFAYDARGNKISETSSAAGAKTMTYDLADRRTRLTWPGAAPNDLYVTYDYLNSGEMSVIREKGATSGVGVLAQIGYDDLGRRTILIRGNGLSTSYAYNAATRLSGLTLNHSSIGVAYTFGNYNPAGQLGQRSTGNGGYEFQLFNTNRGYTANGLNQYTAAAGQTLAYDGRGNTIGIGTTGYSYNLTNQLRIAPTGYLTYDPLGRLNYASQSDTRFDYDGDQMITEMNGTGSVRRRYVFGPGVDEPLVWYEGSTAGDRRFLAADERGSIVQITDNAGNKVAIDSYNDFGAPAQTNIGRFQYTGQAWLPEAGLYYYKARMYNPILGRFMQTDPIGYGDGLNMYNYVGGDPVNAVDPSGLDTGFLAPAPAGYTSPSNFGSFSLSGGNRSSDPDRNGNQLKLEGSGTATYRRDIYSDGTRGSWVLTGFVPDSFSLGGFGIGSGAGQQNVVSDVLNHDIGADIVVLAKKVPQPVQNFISDWVINYDCGFVSSASCSASDYVSAALLVTGVGVAEKTAIEGASKGFAKYGVGRAGQIRFFEDRLILRLDVNKPITHMNIQGRMFGVTFNIHFPKW